MDDALKAEVVTAILWKAAASLLAAELLQAPSGQTSAESVRKQLQRLVQELDRQRFAQEPAERIDAALLAFLRDADELLGR